MNIYDRGTVIKIEVEFKDDAGDYFDPVSPSITIKDKVGNVKVSSEGLSKDATGKYSYIWQTKESFRKGIYYVEVKAQSGAYIGRVFRALCELE